MAALPGVGALEVGQREIAVFDVYKDFIELHLIVVLF